MLPFYVQDAYLSRIPHRVLYGFFLCKASKNFELTTNFCQPLGLGEQTSDHSTWRPRRPAPRCRPA